MTAADVPDREARLEAVSVLGITTLISSALTVALAATHEGPGWIGWPADISGALSLLLLAGTMAALVGNVRRRPMRRSDVVGLASAVGAYPAALVVLYVADAILGALGIFW